MKVTIHKQNHPIINVTPLGAGPLSVGLIYAEKPMRAARIAELLERNAHMKEKIKHNEILIKEMKKDFKALYFQSYEEYGSSQYPR